MFVDVKMINASELEQSALEFHKKLDNIKNNIDKQFPWYPYGTLNNFIHLKSLLAKHPLSSLITGNHVADIGAADGDLAFFIENFGYHVDVIDHAPTNFNGLRGAELLRKHLKSSIEIHDVDLDSYFSLPRKDYGLIFFLGILYHLKNPFYILESLSKITKNLLISTRIARFSTKGDFIAEIPVAYLLGPAESNNDATNFWIFSETGLKRLFDRTGWDLVAYTSVGDTKKSNPASQDHDERAFAILRSRRIY